MGIDGAYETMIDYLWTGDYTSAAGRFTDANPALVNFFETQSLDDEISRPDNLRRGERGLGISFFRRFEATMRALFRARSQNLVPFETAALSVLFLQYGVPHIAWNAVAQLSRAVMTRSWTESMVEAALERDPGPQYPVALGMSAAIFDNFMMKIGYGSYATSNSHGHRFEMTNWASVSLPQSAIPLSLDIARMVADGGIFRSDLRLSDFIDLFSPVAPDIVASQQMRWREYLNRAADGTIWDREPFESPYPPTHFHYHDPIPDRLQASYEDVNFELDWMRGSNYHKYSECIMLGGDGLSYMRLIHRLAQNPRRFLRSLPVVIPRFGEAPHGLFHLMHGDWRIWAPLILRMAQVVNNKQIKADPTVEDFNYSRHFLRILVRAFSEYVVEIARTGHDYRNAHRFLQNAEPNLNFAYICYFLYLFGFKYLQMRNAIRSNDSKTLDIIWRENLASARTAKGNKTNYSKMSVIVVYWGYALKEPLQTAFHNTRTLRWLYSHTGWDMIIEGLNKLIKQGVTANVTENLIKKFIRRLNFMHVVTRGLESCLQRFKRREEGTDKNVDDDVRLIKEFIYQHVGTTYAECTSPSDEPLPGMDMSEWGGDRSARDRRNGTPWRQMQAAMHDYRDYVKSKVGDLCGWHKWL